MKKRVPFFGTRYRLLTNARNQSENQGISSCYTK